MFIITVNGQDHVFHNEIEDDFLRFLPEHFECSKEEITVKYVPKDKKKEIAKHLETFGNKVELDKGKIVLFKETKESQEAEPVKESVGTPISLREMKAWPYDEDQEHGYDGKEYPGGKFLGNELE